MSKINKNLQGDGKGISKDISSGKNAESLGFSDILKMSAEMAMEGKEQPKDIKKLIDELTMAKKVIVKACEEKEPDYASMEMSSEAIEFISYNFCYNCHIIWGMIENDIVKIWEDTLKKYLQKFGFVPEHSKEQGKIEKLEEF